MNLQSMTMKAKLGLAFSPLVLLILLVAGLSIKDLNEEKQEFHDFVTGISAGRAGAGFPAVISPGDAARNLVLATKPAASAI